MARRKRKRFGYDPELHAQQAQTEVREVRRLTDQLRRHLRNPPDCEMAGRLALSLAREQGALLVNRSASHRRLPKTYGAGSNAVLRRFRAVCLVTPRSVRAERKMRSIWR
jgi:hypothetical protein